MLRNINKEHMKQQIKEELQIKILKQHEDRNEAPKKVPKEAPILGKNSDWSNIKYGDE